MSDRGDHLGIYVVARLNGVTTVDQARVEMNMIARQLEADFPATNKAHGVSVLPLHEQIVRQVRPALMILSVSVALVLLICCVNVACLLMGRAQTRRREISIRMAVGCTRFRIFRQFLTETTILGILGGV